MRDEVKREAKRLNKTIVIEPRDLGPTDTARQRRSVVVVKETEASWFGWHEDHASDPVIEWPKYAWKEV
jgi:hypothetical protein